MADSEHTQSQPEFSDSQIKVEQPYDLKARSGARGRLL